MIKCLYEKLTDTFLIALSFVSCNQYVENRGEKTFSVENISLHAVYTGYGKDKNKNEDILVHHYESGDLTTFIDYDSLTENSNPYILRTSTYGADDKSNNTIKIDLSFEAQTISSIFVNIETDATKTSNFYIQTYLGETAVEKTNLSSGEQTVSCYAEIDKITIYIDSPKFVNNEKVNSYFKFNYCLPYAPESTNIIEKTITLTGTTTDYNETEIQNYDSLLTSSELSSYSDENAIKLNLTTSENAKTTNENDIQLTLAYLDAGDYKDITKLTFETTENSTKTFSATILDSTIISAIKKNGLFVYGNISDDSASASICGLKKI